MSEKKSQIIEQKDNNTRTKYMYSANSMRCTFHPGELLYVSPIIHNLTIGDVIVYYDPEKRLRVAHRVIKIGDQHVFTRGDNNTQEDLEPVKFENILGIVTWADQDGSIHPVRSGKAGLRDLHLQSFKNKMIQFIKCLLFPLYRVVKSSGVIAKIWHPEIQKIRVKTENGSLLKYIHKNRTVATWDPQNKRFTYQHPYDLILHPPQDASTSPRNE